MATQKKISDYVLKPAFEVASSAIIIIIDSSDGIDEEENVIEDSEILRDISDSQPAGSHENEHTDNESEHATDQSNYSSDEECVDSNVDEDVNTQVNVSLCPNSDCSCMCKGCTDLSISHQLKDVNKSKLIHSHNSKKGKMVGSLTVEKYKRLGTRNILGLLCVHHAIQFFVESIILENLNDWHMYCTGM